MKTRSMVECCVMLVAFSAFGVAQAPKAATYITDSQVKAINASPGVDRQIVSVVLPEMMS